MHETDYRIFRVEDLARVEGEGGLDVRVGWEGGLDVRVGWEGGLDVVVEGDRVVDVQLRIFEPPRFFEALLRGRSYLEVPDIAARVCGICPVAYQTSSANAIEPILGVVVGDRIRDLRRILYLAEWIESHALHVYFLHAPDFLGYPGAVELARDAPEVVRRGLRLKRSGNDIMEAVGGREIHPVNPRIGGFWSAPSRHDLVAATAGLDWALDAARATCEWVEGFDVPAFEVDHELVALHDPDEYAVTGGRVRSSEGLDIDVAEWPATFEEVQVPHSNALHSRIRGRGSYQLGPLARYALNHEQLHPLARAAAESAGLGPRVRNPFHSIVVRAVELIHAVATIQDLVDAYSPPDPAYVEAVPRPGTGHGASEAPRGTLYHRYRLDAGGTVEDAVMIPPTSQNQGRIEADLAELLPSLLHLDDAEITRRLEQAIRNHDPCISCATHFLDLRLERR